jgi:glycosyltransferase involved in cell wall biosynthesis
VVPPEDVAAFTEAMDSLLRQPGLTAALGKSGQKRAARWDIAHMVDAYTSLFLEQATVRGPVALRA